MYGVDDHYYSDEHVELAFYIDRESDTEQPDGDLSVMLYLADTAALGADGTAELPNSTPFRRYYSGDEEMEPASFASTSERNGKRSIVGNIRLPKGQEDGDALCIILDVTDNQNGVRTLAVWDFSWKQGPITVEVPPQYGPIEYFDSPVGMLARLLAYLLIVAIPVLLVRQFVLAVLAAKEKKAGVPERENERLDGTDKPPTEKS